MNYDEFLARKAHVGTQDGFKPLFMPDCLMDFQKYMLDWSLLKGRAGCFEDCGLGKSVQQLAWSQNIVQHTNKPVLILTPLAVAHQTVLEGNKFGIECYRSTEGKLKPGAGIVVSNYDRLHYFDPNDFAGVACDESSCLKDADGARQKDVTDFMRKMKYRSLWTATAAPNDYPELGTSSEALGELGYMDMLSRFFSNSENSSHPMAYGTKWYLKPHATESFWRWVCSWARAVRKPSDLGFDDGPFILPPLNMTETVVLHTKTFGDGLFDLPAVTLKEQQRERKNTIEERCKAVYDKVAHTGDPFIAWCHLNTEGDTLARMIPDAVQISGSDTTDAKEEKFLAFVKGEIRGLVTKPSIGAWGLNFQHCNHMTMFPSHSFEQTYQSIRRCWRFGQKRPVNVEIITTEGEQNVLKNLQRKSEQADAMFEIMVSCMNNALGINRVRETQKEMTLPSWIK